eukprot:gene755-1021_t
MAPHPASADPFASARDTPTADRPNQFVTFSTGDKSFGVDIMSVREIRSWSPTTQLPGRPFGAKGVLDIRGSVVEVYDLSAILGSDATEPKPGHVVLVVAMGATDVGILVDSVSDIIFAEPGDFRDAPMSGTASESAKVSGLVQQKDRLIAILDLNALFPQAMLPPAASHFRKSVTPQTMTGVPSMTERLGLSRARRASTAQTSRRNLLPSGIFDDLIEPCVGCTPSRRGTYLTPSGPAQRLRSGGVEVGDARGENMGAYEINPEFVVTTEGTLRGLFD